MNDYACSLERPADGLARAVRAATWMAGKTTTDAKPAPHAPTDTSPRPARRRRGAEDVPLDHQQAADIDAPAAERRPTRA